MPDNELDLMQWQVGVENTWGTGVTATEKMMGISGGMLTPTVESSHVEEQRGDLTPAYDVSVDAIRGEGSVEGTPNFEQLQFWLDAMFSAATPAGTGPYTRTYTAPGSKPSPDPLTVYRGNSLATRRGLGGLVNELSLEAEPNARLSYSLGLLFKKVEDYTDTGEGLASLNDVAVDAIHANYGSLFIDAWGGTIGDTEYTGAKFGISLPLNFNKGLKPSIGSIEPVDHRVSRLEPDSNQLQLTLELDTTTKAIADAIMDLTATDDPVRRLLRVEYELDANHKLTIDYAGWLAAAPDNFEDEDGIATVPLTFSPLYESNLGSWMKMTLINQVS